MSHHAAIDWGEVTALATAALVFAAALAALYAKRDIDAHLQTSAEDLHATREATKAAQEAAQRQLRASYRPLLIDLPAYGPIDENDEALEGTRTQRKGRCDWTLPAAMKAIVRRWPLMS